MELAVTSKTTQEFVFTQMDEQVTQLLTKLFQRIQVYYDRLAETRVDLPLLRRHLNRAWRVVRRNNDFEVNRVMYGYAAYSVTLEYPQRLHARDFLRRENLRFGSLSFFELSPQIFKVSDEALKHSLTWHLSMLDQFLQDLKHFSQERQVRILKTVVIGQVAPMVYLMEALPKEEVRENYAAYQRRVFFFGLSYMIDHIIDDPDISEDDKLELDHAIESILARPDAECVAQSASRVVQLSIKYLRAFSEEIRGLPGEEALRIHLIAFHRVQLAAQTGRVLKPEWSNIAHLSTAKSFFSFFIVQLLFGRNLGPDYWDRLFPFATFAQLSDDIQDFTKDQESSQRTIVTDYVAQRLDADPLDLWTRVFSDLLHDESDAMCRSMSFLTIKIITGRYMEGLYGRWPTQISDNARALLQLLSNEPPVRCLPFGATQRRQGVTRGFEDVIDSVTHELPDHAEWVTQELVNLCESHQTKLHEDMAYALRGGKCGRSYLIRLVAEHYGVEPKTLLPFMLAVEMAQTGSLVFDDLPSQDDAQLRRGKECLHKKKNVYEAELTGISLVTEPFRVLSEWPIDPSIRVEVTRLSARGMGPTGLCLGQLQDLDESPETFEEFEEMYRLKTSNGFLIPLVGAAIACQAPAADIERLTDLANKLGIAYQIRDDILEESATDKGSERLARRIIDVDEGRARALFFDYREQIFDTIFALFKGQVRAKFLRVCLKLLLLDGETSPYEEEREKAPVRPLQASARTPFFRPSI